MRILIVTQYIYPETFKSSDMAFDLAKRGHQVEVLTGIPNYPEGHYYPGYGIFRNRREKKDGVTFYRCFQTPRKFLPGFLGLACNYISFVISAVHWVLFYFAWKKKYDAIITHEPSPITQIIPAILLKKIRKTPVYSWIMDIWPDSMTCHMGKRMAKFSYPLLNCITNWVYKNSDRILISSEGFAPFVNRDHDYSDKIIYFPNWSEDILAAPIEAIPPLPSGFIIMMAGNIGSGLGIDSLLSLFEKCRDIPDLHFVLVGGGSAVNEMTEYIVDKELTNVHMMGRFPQTAMHSFYDKANAMLITLAKLDLSFLQATVPARLQNYMSAGKPILGMADGDVAKIINGNRIGFCSAAGDYEELSRYIREEVLKNPSEFSGRGKKSRNMYEKMFTREMCINNLETILTNN